MVEPTLVDIPLWLARPICLPLVCDELGQLSSQHGAVDGQAYQHLQGGAFEQTPVNNGIGFTIVFKIGTRGVDMIKGSSQDFPCEVFPSNSFFEDLLAGP